MDIVILPKIDADNMHELASTKTQKISHKNWILYYTQYIYAHFVCLQLGADFVVRAMCWCLQHTLRKTILFNKRLKYVCTVNRKE